jgi:hypothetical protein
MSKDVDKLVDEALDNIRGDRKLAREFLNEIATQIATDPQSNRSLSPVAAKHIETLQRSNEQLVKIIGIKQKETKEQGLSLADKDELFDMIQGAGKNE